MTIDKEVVGLSIVDLVIERILRGLEARPLMAHQVISVYNGAGLAHQDGVCACGNLGQSPPGGGASEVVVTLRVEFEVYVESVTVNRWIGGRISRAAEVFIENAGPITVDLFIADSEIRGDGSSPAGLTVRSGAVETPRELILVFLGV